VRTLKKNKGFTLIELVTVIVVLAIIGGFTFSFIDSAIRTYVLAREQSVIYYEGAYIMERIVRELSDATTVTEPASESSSSTLRFTKRHPTDIDTNLEVTFEQSESKLWRNGILIGNNLKEPVDTGEYGFRVTRIKANGTVNDTLMVELQLANPRDASIPPFKLRTKITPNNYTGDYTGRSFNGDYYEAIQ